MYYFWKGNKKNPQPKPQFISQGSMGLLNIPFLESSASCAWERKQEVKLSA